jgi:glycerophosphoryl diester phosphodiesterase
LNLRNELLNREKPLIMAHRGNQSLYPENTLMSLEDAVELGVDVLEVDARLSLDGELIIFHDELVDRTTNGKGKVSDKTLAELKQLDAGYWFTPNNGSTFPYRNRDLEIPTLREAFECFPEMSLNIDLKNPEILAVEVLVTLIKEYQKEDQVLVGSFHDDQIQRFRARMPTVKTAAAPSEVKKFLYAMRLHLTKFIRPRYAAFQVPMSVRKGGKKTKLVEIVSPKFIQKAHSKGIAVMVWTINDPETMKKLIAWGVDGIFTDDPKALLNIL